MVVLDGTGLVPVPTSSSGAVTGFAELQPGIRRPRRGGVVEGVAGKSATPRVLGHVYRSRRSDIAATDRLDWLLPMPIVYGYARARYDRPIGRSQPDRTAMRLLDHRRRPRRRGLSRQGVPRGRPCRRPGAPTARTGSPWRSTAHYDVLIVDRMLPKRDGLSVIGDAARAEGIETPVADPLGARPGRRPGQGPARRRRRLSAEALFVLRAAGPRRGAGAPAAAAAARRRCYRVGDLELDRLSHQVTRGERGNRRCSRANSGCSNI